MIAAIRYWAAAVGATGWYGGKVIVSAWRGVRHRPGGVYDEAQAGWARILTRATGVRVEIVHAERIVESGACVYISNHASWLDIWALLAAVPRVRFVFKKELLYVPVLGAAMRAMGHIAIDRTNRLSAFAVYDGAAEQVQGGTPAVVFAEGTRSRDGRLQPFKKGPFVLAIAAQVPVVPVFCENTFELMPKGSLAPRPGSVRVHLGTPIATAGMGYEERDLLAARCRAELMALGAPGGTGTQSR